MQTSVDLGNDEDVEEEDGSDDEEDDEDFKRRIRASKASAQALQSLPISMSCVVGDQ